MGVLVGDQVGAFLKEVLVEAQAEGLGVLNLGEVAWKIRQKVKSEEMF